MEIKLLSKNEESNWDDFVKKHPLASIFQSSAWGHFQSQLSKRGKYWIVAIKENNKIIAGSLIISKELPKGLSWLYAARGPLIDYSSQTKAQAQLDAITLALKSIAKKEKSIFLRIDPTLPLQDNIQPFKGFKTIEHGFQPQDTLTLDLTKSENSLLEQMKPKGRYNIRLAAKKGVEVKKMGLDGIEIFYKLLNETTTRDKFSGHNKNYYKTMLETLSKDDQAAVFVAYYQDKPVAALIATFHKDTAIYYYGASSNDYRNVMAPYLLQWETIKYAKQKGLKVYDFLGISPANQPNHTWAGVTQFKLKFGGKHITYTHSQEKPIRPILYWAYKLYKRLH